MIFKATSLKRRFDQAANLLTESTHCLPLSDDSPDAINKKRSEFNQNFGHREKLGKV